MKRLSLAFMDALETLSKNAQLPHQRQAWERFLHCGLPTRKTEGFQKLPLHQLYQLEFFLEEMEETVTSELPKEVIALPLFQAFGSYGALLQNTLQKSNRYEEDPFVLLTAALSSHGRFLYVPPNTTLNHPIELSFKGDSFGNLSHTFLYVGAGSKISVVTHSAKNLFFTGLLDIVGAEGSEVEVTQNALDVPQSSCHFASLRVSLKKDCKFKNCVIAQGSKLMRHLTQIDLIDEGAEANVFGAALLSGNLHFEQNVKVRHKAPSTLSSQTMKNVLGGKSRSNVQSFVRIDSNALHARASQLNHNLLLSDSAKAATQPHMEILADDVKASHGASFGQLDEEQLIYFKTRGISSTLAKNLLILGFCKEVIEEIPCCTIRNQAATKVINLLEE